MKMKTLLAVAGLAILPAATMPLASFGITLDVAPDPDGGEVRVMDVARRGDAVVGMLVNRGNARIRDIRLLIDMPFLWANEVKPGDDNPGRSAVLTVTGPLEPRGQLAFEFTPNPPLPQRTDGHFTDPQVHVLGYQTITLP
jgi:hypothetical protein